MITGAAGGMAWANLERDARAGFKVVGLDQRWRQPVFGPEASSPANRWKPIKPVPRCSHYNFDIRNRNAVENFFGLPV